LGAKRGVKRIFDAFNYALEALIVCFNNLNINLVTLLVINDSHMKSRNTHSHDLSWPKLEKIHHFHPIVYYVDNDKDYIERT
jgi:hypothetical protein